MAPRPRRAGGLPPGHESDRITIDAEARLLQLEVHEDELTRRRASWKPLQPRYGGLGAVTD